MSVTVGDLSSDTSSEDNRSSLIQNSFRISINDLLRDPLMNCFKENEESHRFMLERIEEILQQSMEMVNDQSVKQYANQVKELQSQNGLLQDRLEDSEKQRKQLEVKFDNFREGLSMQSGIDFRKEKLDLNDIEGIRKCLSMNGKQMQGLIDDEGMFFKEVDELKQLLNKREEEIKEKESLISEQDQELKTFKKKNQTFQRGIKSAADHIAKLIESNKKKEGEIGELKKMLSDKNLEIKRLEYKINKSDQEFDRKSKLLDEEIAMYNNSMKHLDMIFEKQSRTEEEKDKILKLEDQCVKLIRKSQIHQKDLNDSLFVVQQKEKLVGTLKAEILKFSKKLSTERKESNELQKKILKMQDLMAEKRMEYSLTADNYQNIQKEVKN